MIIALGFQLKGRRCRVYTSDLRVKVQTSGLYTYPDVSVVCGQLQLEDKQNDVMLNSTVIVEILSESREAYDRGRKFELYRGLASLREYVLVSQHKPLIENYVRQDSGAWMLHETAGLEGKVNFPSLGITIEMADVYANIRFVPIRLHPK